MKTGDLVYVLVWLTPSDLRGWHSGVVVSTVQEYHDGVKTKPIGLDENHAFMHGQVIYREIHEVRPEEEHAACLLAT